MLRLRVLTALIAAPAIIAAIFLLPIPYLAALFLVLAGIGGYEWARLAGLVHPVPIGLYLAALAVATYVLWSVPAWWPTALAMVLALWGAAALVVMIYPDSAPVLKRVPLLLVGFLLLAGTWLALVALAASPAGPWSILWVFLIVWGADIGAYFAGRRYGAHKLAPAVSPGKTWEGLLGGITLAVVAGTAFGVLVAPLGAIGFDVSGWLVASALLAVVSAFGDLFESVLKRAAGVKDSGTLFPGHGGMLDRIDSLLAALPCFAYVVVTQQP